MRPTWQTPPTPHVMVSVQNRVVVGDGDYGEIASAPNHRRRRQTYRQTEPEGDVLYRGICYRLLGRLNEHPDVR